MECSGYSMLCIYIYWFKLHRVFYNSRKTSINTKLSIPEYLSGSATNNRETPDVDGTYGTNNPGYRFFLANGTAVECSGTMVSCVYSDAPLSLSAVEIKTTQKK